MHYLSIYLIYHEIKDIKMKQIIIKILICMKIKKSIPLARNTQRAAVMGNDKRKILRKIIRNSNNKKSISDKVILF